MIRLRPGTFKTSDGCAIAYGFSRPDTPAIHGAIHGERSGHERPDARPVVMFSNSLGTDRSMWAPQIEALAEHCDLLVYDTRGHGASDVPKGDYTLARLGADVVELLDALGLHRVHFCGLSLGGMTGQWLGIHAADRIERLILANTSAHMPPVSAWNDRIALVCAQGMAAVADAVLSRWFTRTYFDSSADVIAQARETFLSTDPVGYTGCCAAVRDMDQREAVNAIRAATLVIGGAQDPATPPADAEHLAHAIAGAKLVMLDAAHLSNLEQPEGFSAAVLSHIRGR